MILAILGCAPEEQGKAAVSEPEAIISADCTPAIVGTDVAFQSAGTGAGLAWDFGDGASAEGVHVAHAYADPGRYTVRLTATGSDGRTDTDSTSCVAVNEPLATPPTQSGRLALYDGGVYAIDGDEVVVVAGGEVSSRLEVCSNPVSLSAAAGVLAVACRDDVVQLWDLATLALVTDVSLPWGSRPVGIAADPDGGAVVALAGTGEVVHVGGDAHLFDLQDARGIALADGVPYASRFRSPDAGGQVASDTETFTLALDPGPDSDTDARGLPTMLGAVAVSPDGRTLVVAGSKANIERGLRRDGLPYTFETATRAALRAIDLQDGTSNRALFDNRDMVGAVAFTPMGDLLLVAHYGSGMVDLLDPVTLTRIGGFQSVGVGLDGIASDGATAWVLASVDRELVAYDLSDLNAETEIARIPLGAPDLGAQVFANAGDRRMSQDGYLSCASCHLDGDQDARVWDFTDRGEGFRNTQPLWAMPGAGPFHWTANFDEVQDFENAIRAHQAGTGFLSDEDFAATEDPLGEPKAGLSPELDALAAYISTFRVPRSPWRNADGSWTDAALRGRAEFEAEACDDCHAGAELTDGALHDVGTLVETSGERIGEPLTGLRTPSLRGLHASGPYLHDGRAATVEDALTAHGIAPDADLVRYLLEIEGEP